MDIWIKLISDLGFPITITLFTLFRLEKTIQALTEEIKVLAKKIETNKN